jgi:hypothetical protein
MADPKGAKEAVTDGTSIHANNAINVVMEDLSEEDREEVEHELEGEMVERCKRKLVCFQKTRSGIGKKADTVAASRTKVDFPLSPEDLVQLVYVSVASKYGADLTQFIQVIADDMCSTLDMFKQDLHNTLPRQVRAIVQQVSGEVQGKRVEGSPTAPGPSTTTDHVNPGTLATFSQPNTGVNLNLQQLFYQTMAYGLNISPMGSGVQHGPIPDVLFPRTLGPGTYPIGTDRANDGGMTDGVREQIARTLREFGFTPNSRARTYQKPYPEYFDTIPYPRGFRIPDFLRFNGDDARMTHEHVGHFLAQDNDVGITYVHRVCLFPLSLLGMDLNWFKSLAPNTIDTWSTLEQKFYDYFYNGEVELRLSDLMSVRNKYTEI